MVDGNGDGGVCGRGSRYLCPSMINEATLVGKAVSTAGPLSKGKFSLFDSGFFCCHHPGQWWLTLLMRQRP